ncbi:MAG: ROK family transcriptional regulator [Mogibacterium sp.]|nr:ROK family transcriptional regulator [Mogibacterium sp.]
MARTITPDAIRKNNRKMIYDYIYSHSKVSQNDIVSALRLSRPTVTANISELEEDGMICRDGQQDSDQIGRKAIVYSVVPDYRIAIGVELTGRHVKIINVDLYGRKIDRVVHKVKYENNDTYYSKVCDLIMDFTGSRGITPDQVIGMGIAMQGLVSPDGNTVIYGEIMKCTGVTIDVFQKRLPYKCTFIHDPEGAALSELWVSPELSSAIYLSISEHLGGALILDRNVVRGKSGHSATFEHIQYDPHGEKCYCGKTGCFETVLSMHALLGDEDADEFFAKARTHGTPESKKWHSFLQILGSLIGAVHLVNDVDFILGGHLAPYFTKEDIRVLYDVVRVDCPFEEPDDYILISKMPSHNINIGAALPYIKNFLDNADYLTRHR